MNTMSDAEYDKLAATVAVADYNIYIARQMHEVLGTPIPEELYDIKKNAFTALLLATKDRKPQ
jgi:hypothetical protein